MTREEIRELTAVSGTDADPGESSSSRKETMGGLGKGLAIIEMFGAGADRLTLADAARGTGSTRAAARRCLLTLLELGYVSQEGRYFIPQPRLRRLGGHVDHRAKLVDHAQPILNSLCQTLEETCTLTVLDGTEVLYVARAEAARFVKTGVPLGGRMPAYATAGGRLLLGGLSDREVLAYLETVEVVARTPRTITDKARLFEIIVAARGTGVSYGDEELELGMRTLAVSVYHDNRIIAAIGLSTLAQRATVADMSKRFVPTVKAAANDLENSLRQA